MTPRWGVALRTWMRRLRPHTVLDGTAITLWVAGFVVGLVSRIDASPRGWTSAPIWLTGLGVAAALAATVPGLVEASRVRPESPAGSWVLSHLCVASASILLYLGCWLVLRGLPPGRPASGPVLTASGAGLALLAATVWVGRGVHRRRRLAQANKDPSNP